MNLMIRCGLPVCLVLLLAGCATIDGRIKTHPQIYFALSSSDRRMIRNGQIRNGLRKSAVYLAWGSPRQIRKGNRRGRPFEAWIYTMVQEQVIPRSYSGPNSAENENPGYGPHQHWGRFGRSYDGPPDNPSSSDVVAYEAPYKTAFFEDGICTGWEFRR
jgi:hypothetical protein